MIKKRWNNHCHVLNEQIYPWAVHVNRLTIPKKFVGPIAEALKYSPTAVIALERIIEMVGDDPHIHLVETLKTFTSNFGECVQYLLEYMDKSGIHYATPLMLDMTAGDEIDHPEIPWDLQVKLFGRLHEESGGRLRPFYGFDPRRDGSLETCMEEIHAGRFFGIKLYPAMGFSPGHTSHRNSKLVNTRLAKLYAWAEHHMVPITMHSSPGGIRGGKCSENDAKYYTHPERLWSVFFDFPDILWNYAHFGGNAQFVDYWLNGTENRTATAHRQMMEFQNKKGDVSFHQQATATDAYRKFTKAGILYGRALRACMGDIWACDSTLYGDDYGISLFEFNPLENQQAFRLHCAGDENYDLLTCTNGDAFNLQLML